MYLTKPTVRWIYIEKCSQAEMVNVENTTKTIHSVMLPCVFCSKIVLWKY